MQIVLASHNMGKVKEIASLLAEQAIEVLPMSQFSLPAIEETASTFIENALLKARHVSQYCGLPVLADDSGLLVPALGNAPGVISARYAGAEANDAANIRKLLTNLEEVALAARQAYFYCCLVLLRNVDDAAPFIAQGYWHGNIATQASGSAGFGYDPVFYVPTEQCTAAELSFARKNAISHRAQALQVLLRLLKENGL